MANIQNQKFVSLGLQKTVSSKGVVSYHTHLDAAAKDNPILVLLHGYPQSSYIWRLLIPLLPNKPLFVPDLPGYGLSASSDRHDKVSIGLRVIEALKEQLGTNITSSETYPPIVLIGHDRGARVAHLLHVSTGHGSTLGFKIIRLALFDIVPSLSQWQIGDSAAAQTGYFHWSFLANVDIAKPMIMAYGGRRWAIDMMKRWSGTNAKGLEQLWSEDSQEVYGSFFDNESVVEASCRDYEAGAKIDLDLEEAGVRDQKWIVVPLLLVYSQTFLPKRAKRPIPEVWSQSCSDGLDLITSCPIGSGVGHFVPEEAPEETAQALLKWLPSLIV